MSNLSVQALLKPIVREFDLEVGSRLVAEVIWPHDSAVRPGHARSTASLFQDQYGRMPIPC